MQLPFSLTGSFPKGDNTFPSCPSLREGSRLIWIGTVWLEEQPLEDTRSLLSWLDAHPDTHTWNALDGDFILSYISPQREQCILYRSLTAAQTIYYRQISQRWSWSTHVEDLFGNGITFADVNLALLPVIASRGEYLPEQTPYRDVWCLRAGQGVCFSLDGRKQSFQHDFRCQDASRLSFEEAAEVYRDLCASAIRQVCHGYKRVGFFLSGGLDSAIMAYEAVQAGLDVVGFHWSWSQLPMFASERVCAQHLAEHLGIPLIVVDGSSDIEAGGHYVQSMAQLPLPYNHAFFCSFERTADLAQSYKVPLLLSGHLGDTLFQSEETEGIQYKHLFRRFGDLLTIYPRNHAWKTIWKGMVCKADNREQSASQAHQRIERCHWLTAQALKQAQAHGLYSYQPTQRPYAPYVYQAIQAGINDEIHRDTLRIAHISHPRGVTIRHPYLSRSLVEFCLALPHPYRSYFAAGRAVSKLLARYAYLDVLPADVIRREVRLPYAAVNERYALQNTEALYDLFCRDSSLVREQIADQIVLERIFDDPNLLQSQSQSLLSAAGVELWLRHVEGRTWQQPDSPHYYFVRTTLPRLVTGETGNVFTFGQDILVCEINEQLLLLKQKGQDILKITQEGTLFLRLLAYTNDISEAVVYYARLMGWQGEEEEWRTWLHTLVSEQWIQLQVKGEEQCLLEQQKP